jgi:hypothetical protein
LQATLDTTPPLALFPWFWYRGKTCVFGAPDLQRIGAASSGLVVFFHQRGDTVMNKAGLFLLTLLIGFIAGMAAGYAILMKTEEAPPVTQVKYFYYRLNDSMVARHGVSGLEGNVVHTLDTIWVETR